MLQRREPPPDGAPHRLRRGILGDELGELALERFELVHERVVLGVGHAGGVTDVVGVAVLLDGLAQFASAFLGGFER